MKKYRQLASAGIDENRNIVISGLTIDESGNGKDAGYTIAQQLDVPDGNGSKSIKVYLKYAFHIADLASLIRLRDALNVAISAEQLAKGNQGIIVDDGEWDDELKDVE